MNPSSSLGHATQRQLVPLSATSSENAMQHARDPSPWNETAFDPYGGAHVWSSPYCLSHGNYTDGDGPVAMSYNDLLQRAVADVARDNDYRTSAVSRTDLENTVLGISLDASNDTSHGGDASTSKRPLRSSTMAMRGDKGTSTSLVTPNIQSISVSSRIEFPNAVRSHPAVTPHEQDAGAALVTLAGLPKKAATKVKTEPHTPRDINLQPTFPELVHAMVTETAATQPDLIEWVQDGQAFAVYNPKSNQMTDLLEKHFRHRKFSSLQRQLNMYGWSKHLKGKFKGAFYNELFHRDRGSPSELAAIRRRAPPKLKASAARRSTPSANRFDTTVQDSMGSVKEEDFEDSVSKHDLLKDSVVTEVGHDAATSVATDAKKGPLKWRLKGQMLFEQSTTPVAAASRGSLPFSPPKMGDLLASPIAFEGVSFSPEKCWSPLIAKRKLPGLVDEKKRGDERNGAARTNTKAKVEVNESDILKKHPAGDMIKAGGAEYDPTTGRIRMILFAGRSVHYSPIKTLDSFQSDYRAHGQPKFLPSPIMPSRISLEERVPPPLQVPPPLGPVRNISSGSFCAPLPLRSITSSTFFLPFMGMTQALTCALGISGTQGCDERPDGVMSEPGLSAAEDRSLFDGVSPQGQKASASGPVLEDRSGEVARLRCGESLASPGKDASGESSSVRKP